MAVEGPRLKQIRIKNYRSVGADWVEIDVPSKAPLVLIGENNAGKSNILRALSLVLGEVWPGNHNPEDHEFFGRSPEGIEMRVHLEVEGLTCPRCTANVQRFIWKYSKDADRPCEFSFESQGCDHTYMNNDLRGQLTCMTVGVDRGLSYQLSYASKWTTLSKVMHRFHSRLTEDDARVDKLKGFYDSLVSTFYEVEEFKDFADSLKKATDDFGGNLPYGLDIDFSAYDASNFFRSLRVFPHLDGEARAYEELGTGQEQVLAMAFTYAYAKAFGGEGLVLAVEEPEAHLHPLAQQWVASKLQGLVDVGVQVVLTTHSPYFVNLSKPGTTALVRKSGEGDATRVIQLKPTELVQELKDRGAPGTLVTSASVGPFYENSATNDIKAGLFARACVLVEGDTEQMGLSVLLDRVGLDLVKQGIALVPVGGVTNLSKWVRYFASHGIPVFPIFDSDSAKVGQDAEKAKIARQDVLVSVGSAADDWSGVAQGPVGVAAEFAVFDADYETAMRTVFGVEYEGLEAEARETLGNAKPLVARYVARQLAGPEIDTGAQDSGWDQIEILAARLSALVPTPAPEAVDHPDQDEEGVGGASAP